MMCVHIHTHTYVYNKNISHKKEWMPFVATWVELEIIILSEVVKQRKWNMISPYVESKKMIQIDLFIKKEVESQT